MSTAVSELRTIAEIAAEAGASWWSARALVRARHEAMLIRLQDRLFLSAADAAEVVAALKARRRPMPGPAEIGPCARPGERE